MFKKWYSEYRSSPLLTEDERESLDKFTEEEFNKYSQMILGPTYFLKRTKITIKDAMEDTLRHSPVV